MSLVAYLLIAIGAVACLFLLITVVRHISAFYRDRYRMSIWAGVFLLAITAVLIPLAVCHYIGEETLVLIIAGVLAITTALLDVLHAGIGMGIIAFLIQAILAVAFIGVVAVAIILYIVRSLRRGNDLVLDTLTGTTSGFRTGVQLFFHFFIP